MYPILAWCEPLRKCEPLNTCWPTHNVKVFRNATFDDYMKARNKAKLAEETSDLDTGDENEPNFSKRKRVQRVLSSSEHSSNESQLPLPPNIKKFSKTINKNLKSLMQQNHILRNLMADTLSEVKEIKNLLLVERSQVRQHKKGKTFFNSPGINFPINSDEELQLLENLLENEEVLENAAGELSELGGSCVYDFIKRTLTLILTNDQALKYSWLGRKGKRIFKDLNLSKLLIQSVEKSGLAKTQKDSEIALQSWLRRASDRKATLLKKI
ncbi:hypothetical protein RI129_010991 [Pyrocoelia pectoralis]|uniref:DUF4806 domain-containing protein n=1 Tax=Pyrocoelia pectoralis TaxID=417401 RepID=A0AAN7V025_9COLE